MIALAAKYGFPIRKILYQNLQDQPFSFNCVQLFIIVEGNLRSPAHKRDRIKKKPVDTGARV